MADFPERGNPSRRAFLKRGSILASGIALGGLGACSRDGGASTSPEMAERLAAVTTRGARLRPGHILTEGEFDLVRLISELVIPETDSPGAIGAGVPEKIDRMMDHWAGETTRTAWRAELAALQSEAQSRHGAAFQSLSPERQNALLETWDRTRLRDETSAWRDIKDMVLDAYYMSRAGATEELRFEIAPGAYHGCLSMTEVGRAWAQ